MDKSYAELKKRTVAEVFAPSPELMKMRKTMFLLMTGFCCARILFSVYEIIFILLRQSSISSALPNICLTALSALFAVAIYNGASSLSFLAAIGGGYSLFVNFGNQAVIEHIKNAGDTAYNIYMLILGVIAVFQLVLFVYIGISKRWKKYFGACLKVNEKLSQR